MSSKHKNRPAPITFNRSVVPAATMPPKTPSTAQTPARSSAASADQPSGATERYRLDISITLQAPYLVHGNDPGRHGLHATLLTDHVGRPVLPGTLLAGRIAEAWFTHGAELGGADADLWFGRPGNHPDMDDARRARLLVRDLVLQTVNDKAFDPAEARDDLDASRIRLDPDTGSVDHGALLMVEQVSQPGAELRFTGAWRTWATAAEIDLLRKQLLAALHLQTQLGAWRSVGFGRVLDFSVEAQCQQSAAAVKVSAPAPTSERQRYSLSTADALCIASSSRRGNVFESADHFTGGTLLGALAQQLSAAHAGKRVADLGKQSALARHFDALRCTHAMPAIADGGRPVPLPQSLIDVDHVGIRDAWCHAEPPSQQGSAIAFQTDWKDKAYAAASASQGWGATLPHLRVRTDIDADGQAKDAALFAYECKASTINSNGQPTHWLFDLDLSAVADPERAAVWAEIEALLAHGLAPLGKTDAHADVSALPDCAAGSRAVWPETDLSTLKAGDRFPLLLVTDALLFTTADIADRSDVDLAALYASAFNSLQQTLDRPDALRYQHHFATQRLAGGGWLHQRYGVFRERPAYQPFVLTEAGSVFVFEVGDDVHAARQVLTHWQRHGLALPDTVVQAHGSSWRDHPYLPQNGYGEIAVQPRHGHDPL